MQGYISSSQLICIQETSTYASGCHHIVNDPTKAQVVLFLLCKVARSKRNAHNKNSVLRGVSPWLREMPEPIKNNQIFLLSAFLLLVGFFHSQQKHYLCFSLNKDSLKHTVLQYA